MRVARLVHVAFVSSLAACAGAPAATTPPTSGSAPGDVATMEIPRPLPASVDAGAEQPIVDDSTRSSNVDGGQATTDVDLGLGISLPTGAAPIPCKSADDCWVSGDTTAAKPIRRPAKLRGKKFKPCVDGEAAPICNGGVCGTMGYGC